MENEEKLTKLKHTVYISGIGVILYGLWSILKVFISYITGDDVFGLEDIEFDIEYISFQKSFLVILMCVIIVVLMVLHYYVGKKAMEVGRYNSKKRFFLIPAVCLLIFYISCVPDSIANMFEDLTDLDILLVSFMVDVGLIVLMIEMIISIIKISYLEKKIGTKRD